MNDGIFQRLPAEPFPVPGHWRGQYRDDHPGDAAWLFQGFALGLGTCVGDLVYAVLALAGMTVLLQYETVRWVLWLGGSVLLLYFAAKMIHSAIYHSTVLAEAGEVQGNSSRQEFFAGFSWPCHRPVPSSGSRRWAAR